MEANQFDRPFQLFDADLLRAKLAARELAMLDLHENGDPFPLIRFEWPELIITDMEERAEFAKHLERKDNLDLRLDDFQVDAIRSVHDGKHTQEYISGATKMGKGLVVGGIIVNTWYDRYSDCKIILVGPNTEHVQNNLFGEASKWRRMMTSYKIGLFVPDVQTQKIVETENPMHFVIIVNTKDGEGMSGYHSFDKATGAPVSLICFDEASGAPRKFYSDATSQTRMLIAISNPRAPSGWFYEAFDAAKGFTAGCATVNSSSGPRRLISVGGVHCVNVKAKRLSNMIGPPKGVHVNGKFFGQGEPIPNELFKYIKPLIPGQMTLDKFHELEEKPPNERCWRAYGLFPKTGTEFDLFMPEWKSIHAAEYQKRGHLIQCRGIGLDVGRSKHGDPSCAAFGDAHGLKELYLEQIKNQMDLQGWLWKVASDRGMNIYDGTIPIGIDYVGVGAGLADSLEAEGAWVIRVENGGAAVRDKMQFMNRRAEVFGELAFAIDPGSSGEFWLIPVDQYTDPWLWEELYAHEKIYTRRANQWRLNEKRRRATQKSEQDPDNRTPVDEKIGRSPDRCDATTLLYQAVRELPEFGDNLVRQFDPAMEVKDVFRDKQSKLVQILYWSGKEETISEEQYEAKFGKDFQTLGSVNWAEELRKSVIAGR